MTTQLFKNSAGYKRLDVYILANIIQLETLVFCRRFLGRDNDPCGRQFDQMTQAARSGVKNITEGSERMMTSMQTTLKLLDVARASLCELRDDYLTYLMDKGLPPWRQSSPEAQAVYEVRFESADYGNDVNYGLAAHIIAQRTKFAPWFGSPPALDSHRMQSPARPIALDSHRLQSSECPPALDSHRLQSSECPPALDSHRLQSSNHPPALDSHRLQSSEPHSVIFANAMIILIGRVLNMLGNLLVKYGKDFVEQGGFSERMTAARVEEKRRRHRPVDDDAPTCPKCGSVMRLRHGSKGDFWGCTGFPACKGTKEVNR